MRHRIICGWIGVVLLILLGFGTASAQDFTVVTPTPNLIPPTIRTDRGLSIEDNEENWSLPINLSRSGAAASPTLVGADDTLHIFWLDTFDGMMYIQGDGSSWSSPVLVSLPFGNFRPQLYVNRETVHALWLDLEDNLFHASVNSESIVDPSAWSETDLVGQGVKAANLLKNDTEQHVVYVQARDLEEADAGIYIRTIADIGITDATPIDMSPYLRLATQSTANVAIAETNDHLVVAWDHVGLDEVLVSYSSDNGKTWTTPFIVDSREPVDGPLSIAPSNIQIVVDGSDSMFIWQSGHGNVTCAQFSTYSENGGETYQPRQQIFGDLLDCPVSNKILMEEDDSLVMITASDEFTYLTQREEGAWKNRVLQTPLMRFTDPVTLRDVVFGCMEAELFQESIYIVGCDEGAGQDIWLTRWNFESALTSAGQFNQFETLDIEDPELTTSATPEPETQPIETVEPSVLGTQDFVIIGALVLVGLILAGFGVYSFMQRE